MPNSQPRPTRYLSALALALTLALSSSSCTIAKPVVCSVTAPILFLAGSDCFPHSCRCDHPEAVAWVFVGISAVGVVGGLISGFVSDMNLLLGHVDHHDACRNLHNPFRSNGSGDG